MLEHNPQDDDGRQLPADVVSEHDGDDLLGSQMVHNHLPKLDDLGFVDWDREAEEIARGPRFEDLRPLLELLDEHREDLPEGWL